jgi:uncharacterized protein
VLTQPEAETSHLKLPMRCRIVNSRTGQVLADSALMADSPLLRMKGLLGRASLTVGEAIILQPASSIHTHFMRFTIDVIYLNRELEVVKVVRALKPFRFSAARRSHTVIELAENATDAMDLRAGDRLTISQPATVA